MRSFLYQETLTNETKQQKFCCSSHSSHVRSRSLPVRNRYHNEMVRASGQSLHHSPQTLLKTEEECFIENLTDTQLGFSRSVCCGSFYVLNHRLLPNHEVKPVMRQEPVIPESRPHLCCEDGNFFWPPLQGFSIALRNETRQTYAKVVYTSSLDEVLHSSV
jgi:hypothetical protein